MQPGMLRPKYVISRTYKNANTNIFELALYLCQASKTAFRSHCARPRVSEASCPNFEPRAHARLTGLTICIFDDPVGRETISYVKDLHALSKQADNKLDKRGV